VAIKNLTVQIKIKIQLCLSSFALDTALQFTKLSLSHCLHRRTPSTGPCADSILSELGISPDLPNKIANELQDSICETPPLLSPSHHSSPLLFHSPPLPPLSSLSDHPVAVFFIPSHTLIIKTKD
jgi:hypothetical protein